MSAIHDPCPTGECAGPDVHWRQRCRTCLERLYAEAVEAMDRQALRIAELEARVGG